MRLGLGIGVPYGSGVLNPDKLSLDLQFATDKTLTARKGPTPTFTRGSGATRVNASGLIEYAPENLVLHSNNIVNAAWTKEGGTAASSIETVNGLTAEVFNENSTNSTHRFFRLNEGLAGITSTFSVWLKAAGRRYVCVNLGSNGPTANSKPVIDLVDRVVVAGVAGVTINIQLEANGWARYSFTFVPRIDSGTMPIQSNFSSTTLSEIGVGLNGAAFYVAGQQYERASTARAYMLTTTAAAYGPRFDHDPVTLACKGLLIEESRTNLITFSESIANLAWNNFTTASATDNQTTSPSGAVNSASRITANAGTSTTRARLRLLTIAAGGTTYSASAFVKAGTSNFGSVSLAFNKSGTGTIRNCDAHIVFSTGVVTKTGVSNANFTVTSTPYPDGWYRITISATSNASLLIEDQVVFFVGLSFDGVGGSGTFAGNETVFAWGAQLEAGSFPTSYIPTTTAALTRSADVCSITGSDFTSMYNSSEGTVVSDALVASLAGNNRGIWAINNNTSAHGFLTYYDAATPGISSQSRNTTATTLAPNFLNSANTLFKRALAYRTGQGSICTNGSSVTTTSVTISTQTMLTLQIGNMLAGSFHFSGHISRIRYFRKRLPDAKLQSLTTP